MTYIEGFVVPVPQANKDAYAPHAAMVAAQFRALGMDRMVQNWGDDVPDGKVTDFRRAVDAKADEAIVFCWMEFPDRAARDAAVERSRTAVEMGVTVPFDGLRMIVGGFEVISDVKGDGGAMGYVDGVLVAVPADGKAAYVDFAAKVAAVFVEHGAMRVVDAWEDNVRDGTVTDYRRALKIEPGEAVVYSWIEWPSKPVRDAAWEKAMADPRMKDLPMPFDGQRMIFGGFAPILDA